MPYIISSQERKDFLGLASSAERKNFIRRFWEIRDPDPSTEINEYRAEHYQRIEHANTRFHDGKPGWKTDRGRVLIVHGPPDDTTFIFGGNALRIDIINPTQVLTGGTSGDSRRVFRLEFVRPETEIWTYRHLDGAHSSSGYFEIIFSRIDPQQLYYVHQTLRSIGLGANAPFPARVARDSAIMNFLRGQRLGGEFRILYAGAYRYPDIDDFYQSVFHSNSNPDLNFSDVQSAIRDLDRSPGDLLEEKLRKQRRLRETVRTQISFERFQVDLVFGSVRSDSGSTLLPVTVGIASRFADDELDLLLELVRADGTTAASLGDTFPMTGKKGGRGPKAQAFRYQARLAARPGDYTLRLYGRLQDRKSVAFSERPVHLPDYSRDDLAMSDVLLFDKVLPKSKENPYQVPHFLGGSGPLHLKNLILVPAADRRFRRGERLTAFVEVYNPGLVRGEPALDLKCRLWQGGRVAAEIPSKFLDYVTETRTGDDESQRTAYGLSIPLRTFSAGEYALELEVFDQITKKRISRKTEFTIR